MKTFGKLLTIDIWLKNCHADDYVQNIKKYVESHFCVVGEIEKKFEPYGMTSVLVLSESHFSIHTYPEHNYISIDLYICNEFVSLEKTKNDLLSLLPYEHEQSHIQTRGVREELNSILIQKMNTNIMQNS